MTIPPWYHHLRPLCSTATLTSLRRNRVPTMMRRYSALLLGLPHQPRNKSVHRSFPYTGLDPFAHQDYQILILSSSLPTHSPLPANSAVPFGQRTPQTPSFTATNQSL